MLVLGIETSCDETSAAVVKNGCKVLSNIVSSSLSFHSKYGGIIPEIAFRKQLETINEVVDCALAEAGVKKNDIGLISVTDGPGLMGSLLVGLGFAKALAYCLKKPIIGVNHLYGHMYAAFLDGVKIRMPFVSLIVSGGHTSLYSVRDFDRIKLLGGTRDDACGEAFDKVAKILGLGYPGGPIIEKTALKGDPSAVTFQCSRTDKPFDFSYSGIKTAVLYYSRKKLAGKRNFRRVADVCAAFQDTALNALVQKSLSACRHTKVKQLVVGGGVAANNVLRGKLIAMSKKNGIEVLFPKKEYCTDNAAMIASLGFQLYSRGYHSDEKLTVDLTRGEQ